MNPKSVWLYQNGMVMAFEVSGDQISELQGWASEILDSIEAVADEWTEWYIAHHEFQGQPLTKEAWDEQCRLILEAQAEYSELIGRLEEWLNVNAVHEGMRRGEWSVGWSPNQFGEIEAVCMLWGVSASRVVLIEELTNEVDWPDLFDDDWLAPMRQSVVAFLKKQSESRNVASAARANAALSRIPEEYKK